MHLPAFPPLSLPIAQVLEYAQLSDFPEAEWAEAAARLDLIEKIMRSCRVKRSEELLRLVAAYTTKLEQFYSMEGRRMLCSGSV